MSEPPKLSDFTVHVFVNHDPVIASTLLQELFSDFPESLWRLPQEVRNPDPKALPNSTPLPPRIGLGRHILPDTLPHYTTLGQLSRNLQQEFGLNQKYLAKFTIFPQVYGTLPGWNSKPLPSKMTLGEVAFLDNDAITAGQYEGVADQYAPVLHVVIETKAAALQRCIGGIVDEKFISKALGREYKRPQGMESWLEAFINAFVPFPHPEIANKLSRWRSAFYSLRYLESERDKLTVQQPLDERQLQEVIGNIEKYQNQKAEAKVSISASADQWEKWILKQDYVDHDHNLDEELRDDDVEDKVLFVLRQRTLFVEWGKSEKKQSLLGMLQSSHLQSGKGLNINDQRQPNPLFPEIIDTTSNESEGLWDLVSKGVVVEQPCHETRPDACYVKTIPFHLKDGTLNQELAKFTLTSGNLSWGQVLPIYYGSLQENFTNNAVGISKPLPGGTIMQHVYTYKSAARTGDWKVRRYYSNGGGENLLDPDREMFQAGWIVCHDDIDPLDILRRVRALGSQWGPGAISNGNNHTDKDVLYIGRYDWSHNWHSPHDRDFEEKFHDWAKIILDADKSKVVPPFPDDVQGQTQDEMIEKKQDIALDLHHKLQQVLLNPKRLPKDDEIPLMAEYISRLEQLPDSDTCVFRNAYMHNTLHGISKLISLPRDDEFDIRNRAGVLYDKWWRLLVASPESSPWYYVAPSTRISGVSHGGYFIAMDSEDFDLDFVKAYKSIEAKNKFMQEVIFSKGGRGFGAYVSFPRMMEDEFAWLVFSGRKHAEYDADELIAIVYDGTYEVFQGLYHTVEAEGFTMTS